MDEKNFLTFFRKNGFVHLKQLFDLRQMEDLRMFYEDALTSYGKKKCDGLSLNAMELVWIHRPENYAKNPLPTSVIYYIKSILSVLSSIPINELAIEFRIFHKPARIGAQINWHQDEAYKNPEYAYNSINIWIPMEDIMSHDEGGLKYIPGSHMGPVLSHDYNHINLNLEAKIGPINTIVSPIVLAGDALCHHCRLLHGSYPNTSVNPRRALVVVCEIIKEKYSSVPYRPWLNDLEKYWVHE